MGTVRAPPSPTATRSTVANNRFHKAASGPHGSRWEPPSPVALSPRATDSRFDECDDEDDDVEGIARGGARAGNYVASLPDEPPNHRPDPSQRMRCSD